MAKRDEIVSFLNELLEPDKFDDLAPNGLQVPGAQEVVRIVCGVSASLELFQRAAEQKAQMVLAHHGLFWGGAAALSEQMTARLRLLLTRDISLVAYHLPLDAHPETGNNVIICRKLGFEASPEGFGLYRGCNLGVVGRNEEGVSSDDLFQAVEREIGPGALIFPEGPERIHTIGVISGGASASLNEAIEKGLDAFLTGEPSEPAMAQAREGGIHYIAAGHYRTEVFGVRNLGEIVAQRFNAEHSFIEIPNPI